MVRKTGIAVVVACVFGLTTLAIADNAPESLKGPSAILHREMRVSPDRSVFKFEGEILSINIASLQICVKKRRTKVGIFAINVPATAKVVKGKQKITLSDLAVGDRVIIAGIMDNTGDKTTITAIRIIVIPKKR